MGELTAECLKRSHSNTAHPHFGTFFGNNDRQFVLEFDVLC